MNQKTETALWWISSHKPTSWSKQLLWAAYTHSALPDSASNLSPFQCSLAYQAALFPEQEREASVSFFQAFVCSCTWMRPWSTILRTSDCYQKSANRHRTPAPRYFPGQRSTSEGGVQEIDSLLRGTLPHLQSDQTGCSPSSIVPVQSIPPHHVSRARVMTPCPPFELLLSSLIPYWIGLPHLPCLPGFDLCLFSTSSKLFTEPLHHVGQSYLVIYS